MSRWIVDLVDDNGYWGPATIRSALFAVGAPVRTVTQAPDIDAPGTTTGRDHPSTSRSAASLAFPRSGTQRRIIYDEIASATRHGRRFMSGNRYWGMTDVMLYEATSLSLNTVRPRRGELVAGGWVKDSGKTFRHAGRDHVLWVTTDQTTPETN